MPDRLKTGSTGDSPVPVGDPPNGTQDRNLAKQPLDQPFAPVPLPIDGVLDLHTIQPREVKDVLLAYIEVCQEKNILEIRVIHGKGIFNLQRTVQSILQNHPAVLSFSLASELYGGPGATIVKLKVP